MLPKNSEVFMFCNCESYECQAYGCQGGRFDKEYCFNDMKEVINKQVERLPWFDNRMMFIELAFDDMEMHQRCIQQQEIDTALSEYHEYRDSLHVIESEPVPEWVHFTNWMEKVI